MLTIFTLLALASAALAHMVMSDPPTLRSQWNPFSGENVDWSITSPLSSSGSDFPCKGSLNLVGTPEGQAVATWSAGEERTITISGGAPHNGGSCQVSFSFDGGSTFRVLHSWIGGCPIPGPTFTFRVPTDTPSFSGAIFAWTWFNNLGNREMYMNCAVVDLIGNGNSDLSNRPTIFVANIGNGCRVPDSVDLMFPNPGPDTTVNNPNAAYPEGSCEVGPGASQENSGSSVTSAPGGGAFEPGNDWPTWFSGAKRLLNWGASLQAVFVSLAILFLG